MQEKAVKVLVILFELTLFLSAGYFAYRYTVLAQALQGAERGYRVAEEESAHTIHTLEEKIHYLEEDLLRAKNDYADLSGTLHTLQETNVVFKNQIEAIMGTVGTLEKLRQIDDELLRKYSKVYFLNENYIPAELLPIDPEYLLEKEKSLGIHAKVRPYLTELLLASASSSLPLEIVSAYRSFGAQALLRSTYVVTYGTGKANTFSAEQGYSEHQLGTTVDFTTPELGATFTKFESAKQYAWLTERAHEYGFTLSYPKKNTYYQYEPWHWRFVGVALATKLHNSKQYFYDLEQREIDIYLENIFD